MRDDNYFVYLSGNPEVNRRRGFSGRKTCHKLTFLDALPMEIAQTQRDLATSSPDRTLLSAYSQVIPFFGFFSHKFSATPHTSLCVVRTLARGPEWAWKWWALAMAAGDSEPSADADDERYIIHVRPLASRHIGRFTDLTLPRHADVRCHFAHDFVAQP